MAWIASLGRAAVAGRLVPKAKKVVTYFTPGEKQAVRHYCRLFVATLDPVVIYIFSDSDTA